MPEPLTLACHAMATRFEIVLHGDNPVALRAAGEEALEEINHLEAQLSLFRPESEISHLNASAARRPVRVSPPLFALLEHARRLNDESGGAFDITIAPLMQCWGFMGGSGHFPTAGDLAAARARVGMSLVHLDPVDLTVEFAREGVMLDFGAIGKGYAIERAAQILVEAGVTNALLHGGTSTIYALGHPPDSESWRVAIGNPNPQRTSPAGGPGSQSGHTSDLRVDSAANLLAAVSLEDEALSVSAVSGKFFRAEGKSYGHVLDPRTGEPAANAVLAAVALPSATETDALSTALLALGPEGHPRLSQLRPGMRTLLARDFAGELHLEGNLAGESSASDPRPGLPCC